jgi:uroporphyrinogen-III synthase
MILKGKTLAITRSERDAEEFSRLVAAEGGKAIALPTIEIVPAGPQAAREFLDKLHDKKHDYCAFMSSQAVSVLFEHASKSEIISALESTAVIAVGPKTRQSLEERGISVRLMPEKFSSAGLVELLLLLSGAKPASKKIIIPRSGAANEFATEALTKIGMQVDEVSLYSVRTCAPSSAWGEFSALLLQKKVDAVIFTSASSVGSFFEIMAKISPSHPRLDSVTRVVSIGPFTSKELRGRGIIKCFEVKEHTVKGALELAKNIV